ncbi:hypothetical protein CRM22_009121 [Opisthorchis felineus]|uniref:PDZ domain-containing protein n=1 Tax=Opisthorchis felineus TaxID=147828 RepID=A0A4S2L8X7_OPIFE|nr:hypothetical protein CRM22_009121 [Opisthorchis felineus]
MKLGEILFLLGSLDRKFREKKHLRLSRCTSHVSAVISSELYERCSKILQTMKASDIQQELSDLLTQSHVQPPRPGLPPLSSDALKLRVEEIRTHDATEFYLIQLPEPSSSQPFRRSGLILRQHLVDGEIKNLFVAGVERGSPADRAYNIKSGDQLLAIVGFPLDWRTLTQLRYGLLTSPEVQTLKSNANLFELAEHLLDEPYRRSVRNNSSVSSEQTKAPNLIVARNPRLAKQRESQAEDIKHKTYVSGCLGCVCAAFGERIDILTAMTIALLAGRNAIHVISIQPDSQAGLDGILKEGDRVVEVNYQDIQQLPAPEALKRIKAMCHKANFVHIKVLRPIITRENSISSSITAARRVEKSKRQESVEGSESSPDTRRSFRPERSDSTVTAVAVPAAEEDDLTEDHWNRRMAYWKSIFPESTKILIVEYDTEDSVCGLGLGIEGTMEKDTEHNLPRPHHYVIDVLPDSPVELRENVISGDELLEVNKIILYEMDHLEVAKVLHEIPNHGYLIFGRHQINDVDILTPTHPRRRVNIVRESEEAPNLRASTPGETIETLDSSTSSDGSDIVCPQPNDAGSRSSSSDATSDIDKCSPMDKIIFFNARGSHEAVQSKETKNVFLDDVDEVLELPRRHRNISREKRELPDHIQLKERPQSAIVSNVPLDPNGCSFSRLPMPARVASIQSPPLQPPLRPRDFAFTRKRVKSQVSDDLPPPEVKFHNDEQCFSVHIFKQCGEFLGLELDAENGGPKGIRLMNITPGSALHRLIEKQRHSDRQSGSCYRVISMVEQHVSSRLPLPEPGDWIVGVAGCNFKHRSEFQARLLLRRLVLESGSFEIRYIPSETSAPLCKQAWNGVHSEPDLSRVSDQ